MESGVAHAWVDGAAVRWTRRRTHAAADNAAERFSDRFEIRWARGAAFEPIDVSSEDQATAGADFVLYRVPGGRHVVIEQNWIYADEGVSGHATIVFVCDRTTRTCQ